MDTVGGNISVFNSILYDSLYTIKNSDFHDQSEK